MQLTVLERILLLNLLPKEGNVITLRVVRKVREALSFSDEEQAALDFRHEGEAVHGQEELPAAERKRVPEGQIVWNQKAEPAKEFRFGETALKLIRKELTRLDTDGKLNEPMVPLYDKFFPPPADEEILEVA